MAGEHAHSAATGPAYFCLHIPKTAGETIEYHLAAHCPPGSIWMPRRAPAPLLAFRRPPADAALIRAVAGHHVSRSLERHFAGRDIRRVVLLREPLSLQLSLYNYRMMNHLAKGHGVYSFVLHMAAQPRNLIAHYLLHRWLEIPQYRVAMMCDGEKYRLANEALSRFWYVGSYSSCDRLIAAMAADLGIPPVARWRNTAREWHRQINWRPLTEDALPAALCHQIRAQNSLDSALWESWRGAGFATAAVRARPLADPQNRALMHDILRPSFELARLLQRNGAPLLRFVRRNGLRSGIARADRARDAKLWHRAARLYRRALSEEPNLPAIWVQYGHALKQLGDFGAAEQAYRMALRIEPDYADTHLQLGHLLKMTGREDAAAQSYVRAISCAGIGDPVAKAARQRLLAAGWTADRIAASLGVTGQTAICPGDAGTRQEVDP